MKKSHKVIVALIFIITILLIIFLSKDFIIRKYFISLLENVDYDEYILEVSINGKKSAIYYYTPEYVMERNYDNDSKLNDCIITKNYFQNMEYYYFIERNETISTPTDTKFIKPLNINNDNLLTFLNQNFENDKKTFKFKGLENINNIKCYVLEFKDKNSLSTTIYLSKELLYTVKIDTHMTNMTENKFITQTIDNHVIYDYTLDLTLKQKYLFEF